MKVWEFLYYLLFVEGLDGLLTLTFGFGERFSGMA